MHFSLFFDNIVCVNVFDNQTSNSREEHAKPVEGIGTDAALQIDYIPTIQTDSRFINRELSWLDFNARVLACATDPKIPLIERAKFLAIFTSNLDEFFMVRVAGLKRREQTGLSVRSSDGLTPREQLARIAKKTQDLAIKQARIFIEQIRPALSRENIRIAGWDDLQPAQKTVLKQHFHDQIFPLLTPLAFDPAHPFPYISGLSVNLAITVADDDGNEFFSRLKVPDNLPRLIRVDNLIPHAEQDDQTPYQKDSDITFLLLDDFIKAHLDELFPGLKVVESDYFRVTRNADFEFDEDKDEDLLQALERELAQRRFGTPVRLEITDTMSDTLKTILMKELEVDPADVIRVPGILDLSFLFEISGLERSELKDTPFVPLTSPAFAENEIPKSIFSTLQEGDVLTHHPYQSFSTSVQRFIEQAAQDPNVLAIKQTLYRTSGDSPIVDALIAAAEAGKQVAALVEIKARFDEQANIAWARKLEKSGVHVIYGLIGLKTHCKTCLVVRREGNTIRRYCHIGTGNYNPKTARLYEDLGFFTASPDIGADLTDLFNSLTGYSQKTTYRNLLVAPSGIRSGIIEKIHREIELFKAGKESGIDIKVNSLVDEQVIDVLYKASQTGVPVRCFVRGICVLKAGVPGLSENITVHSILGRFLEHSRVFRFRGADEYWIGSADIMHRNLDRRVEVLVRITDPRLTHNLANIFEVAFDPAVKSWNLNNDGSWSCSNDPNLINYQQAMMQYYS